MHSFSTGRPCTPTSPNRCQVCSGTRSTRRRRNSAGRVPLDGYAVLHFASRDLAKAAWDSPAGVATAQDGTIFMASARPLIVDELEVLKLNVADSNQR